MTQISTLSAEDLRAVLQTAKTLRNVGILRADFFQQIMKKFPRFTPGSDGLAFYKFIEDYDGTGTLARRCDRNGTIYAPTSTAVTITHDQSWGRPVGAKADYVCLTWGRRFLQGPCPDTSCDVSTSSITVGSPPAGTVNESYSHTITWANLTSDPTIEGLPLGLSYNMATGAITGTPTAEGEYTIILRGTSVTNECPITEAFNLVINSCDFDTSTLDPDDPPDGTLSVAYSHTVLFSNLDGNPSCIGLPPGLSFNNSTGEISGTPTQEGTWVCTLSGTTLTNGCPISVEFSITIGTCDNEDSRIFNLYPADVENELPYGRDGEEYFAQVGFINVDLPMTLYTSCGGCDFPTGLTFDGNNGTITGTPTECGIFDFQIHADSSTYDCFLSKAFRLVIFCECPDWDDYATLDAWLVSSLGATSSESINISIPFADTFSLSNAAWNTTPTIVENLPPGLFWDPLTGTIEGIPDTAGIYATRFHGTVTAGDYVDCPIVHTRTYTVS